MTNDNIVYPLVENSATHEFFNKRIWILVATYNIRTRTQALLSLVKKSTRTTQATHTTHRNKKGK